MTFMMARTSAVPVSIEPKRPSPIVNETILAFGATPSTSLFPLQELFALAMDATCVPWLAGIRKREKLELLSEKN